MRRAGAGLTGPAAHVTIELNWEFAVEDDDEDRLMMTESTRQEIEALGIKVPRDVAGRLIEVVPDNEAREMLVICLPNTGPKYFDDDVIAKCDRCKQPIRHRPHIPLGAITICTTCFLVDRASKGKPGLDELLGPQ